MKVTIISIGQKQPEWINSGVNYYLRHLPLHWSLKLLEIKPIQTRPISSSVIMAAEGKRILEMISNDAYVCALSEHGKNWSTVDFSRNFEVWENQYKHLIFVIGGSYGLDKTVIERASISLRLSSMTFPHALARLLLVEQLYRLSTLQKNHPYHRV